MREDEEISSSDPLLDYYQIIDTLLFSGLQAEELEERLEEFEASHGKESRSILEHKLEQVARNVLAYYFS